MKTNRRTFLGAAGSGLTGLCLNTTPASANPPVQAARREASPSHREGGGNPRDVKINVKLVYYAMINSTTWEGPCVYDDMPTPEEKVVQERQAFARTVASLKDGLSHHAVLLEPAYFEFPENAKPSHEDIRQLDADKDEVDVFFLTGAGSHQELRFASLLADTYKKPIVPAAHYGRTTAAYLKSIGMEGYPTYVYGDQNKLIGLLRARKAFQQCRMLLVTDIGGALKGPGYMRGSARDFDDLKNRFGIGVAIVSYKELSEARERILQDRQQMQEVEGLADRIWANARQRHMEKEVFQANVLFYHTIKSLMEKHRCNSYSIECIEFCASRLAQAWKVTPCVSFSLLNAEGYPTACEGEIGCLLAMNLFSSIADKSVYLGNLNPHVPGVCDPEQWAEGADRKQTLFRFGHNVPGLKMLGYNQPDLPYEIRNFVPAKNNAPGWGGSFKVDFTKIEDRILTLGRFNPSTTKLLAAKVELVGMRGFNAERCSTEMHLSVADPKEFHLKTADYGHHYVAVYGDYLQELAHLGDMLGIEVQLHGVA